MAATRAQRLEQTREWLRRARRWFRAPRRLRFTRAGWLFTAGALAIGIAAIPTGNNLLFLLLGSMLGFIAVSGWLSEQSIQRLRIERRIPRGVTAGKPFRIGYRVHNAKRRMPSLAVELREPQLEGAATGASPAWLASLGAEQSIALRSEHVIERRGVYTLDELTLATGFPFGLFHKERDVALAGTLVVWPRSDRPVRDARTPGGQRRRTGEIAGGAAGPRGEFRNLRDYRPGDDPRDVHWRSSARLGMPLVREFERERAETVWICLDLGRTDAHGADAEEDAVELAASLARTAIERARPVGLATSDMVVDEGTGPAQLERILDALARVTYRPDAPAPRAPVGASAAVLVSHASARGGAWADVYDATNVAQPAARG
ncbi:MAG TPA: DUF58 domain-containing protein [Thermoanaerobaculia bacterium]